MLCLSRLIIYTVYITCIKLKAKCILYGPQVKNI